VSLVSRPHGLGFPRWAADKPEVLVLSADLTSSCEVDTFRQQHPDRFFSMGMAEQNMMGFAAGLAREGFEPWVHTFAVFITRRPFDQVAMSIGYPKLKVRLVGFLPGITTPGGVTHQAIDDVALMRAIPNMTVLDCGDATDVESVLDVAHAIDGPVYIRMLRGEVPRLFDRDAPMRLERARFISRGRDVVVVSSGICTEEAMRAGAVLRARGVGVTHLHVSTLKPFDDPSVMYAIAKSHYGVVTMENHLVTGGLGTAVAEAMAEAGLGRRLIRIGLNDRYAHGASRGYLMKKYGLDASALVGSIERLIGQRLDVTEAELAAARVEAVHSSAKAEAL
jgi:transketolase